MLCEILPIYREESINTVKYVNICNNMSIVRICTRNCTNLYNMLYKYVQSMVFVHFYKMSTKHRTFVLLCRTSCSDITTTRCGGPLFGHRWYQRTYNNYPMITELFYQIIFPKGYEIGPKWHKSALFT